MFRKEALIAKKGSPLGEIIALRPVSTSILVGIFSAFAICLILLVLFGSYTKRVKVYGQLIPAAGLVKIYAPQTGTVIEKRVDEGSRVNKGDLILAISSERYDDGGTGAQEKISHRVKGRLTLLESERIKLQELHKEELAALDTSISGLIRTIDRFDGQIALQRSRVELAQDSVARYRTLSKDNLVSKDQYQDRLANQFDQKARYQELTQLRADAAKDLAKQESDRRALPIKHAAALSQLDRDMLATSQELMESEAKRNLAIVAPESGIASGVITEVGQHVDPNRPLLNIIPDDAELIADIYIRSKDIGFTREGDRALIRYTAYPYQKFGTQGAKVKFVSAVASPASEIATISGAIPGLDQNAPQDLYYRAGLKLDSQTILAYGKNEKLVPGMTLEVDILRENRAIYEWILEPLYSLTGRMQ